MSSKNTYYKRKKERLQQKARNHYHQVCGKEKTKCVLKKNREILQEHAQNKYRELINDKKVIIREIGRNQYKNMSEEDKKN